MIETERITEVEEKTIDTVAHTNDDYSKKTKKYLKLTRIKHYIISNQQKIKDYVYLTIFIVCVFLILFSIAKTIKTETNFYSEDLEPKWDRILSYDEMFYARKMYSDEIDTNNIDIKFNIVKHPLMGDFGYIFSSVENILCHSLTKTDHYFHIVFFQILINLMGTIYLYKILREQFELRNRWCFLLLMIYQLSTVTILCTILAESFIISGSLLIISYYYLNKQKIIPSIILGICLTGVTITNCIPFAIMAIILLKNKKDILKVGIGSILGLSILFFISHYRDVVLENFITNVSANAERFSKSQEGMPYAEMIFHNLLSSPLFFIKQENITSIKFVLSSGRVIATTTVLFFIVILYNIIKNINDRQLLAALLVFIYNMCLHAVIKFSLYEGTIFGLHFLFAEILMFAFGFKSESKKVRYACAIVAFIILIVQLRYNINGFLKMLLFLPNIK